MIEHAITPAQVERKVLASLETSIRRALADPNFCPDSARITRFERMPISTDLIRDLNARWQECWLSADELNGEPE